MRILMTEFVTHDVKRFIVEKPAGYSFVPGQASMVSINKEGLEGEERPFTFTNSTDDLVFEFVIKRYPSHNGVTDKLHQLTAGDDLIIKEPWGTITYNETGTFLAGGAGITPFIAIFRDLERKNQLHGNKLIFSNRTARDIILEQELKNMFGENLILTLTREKNPSYEYGSINEDFLKDKIDGFNRIFYICGPKPFVEDIKKILIKYGTQPDSVIFEK